MAADRSGQPGGPPRGLRRAGLIAGPVAAALVLMLHPDSAMPPAAWRMLAIAVWVVLWWLTEALPLPATALLPLILMPLMGVQDMRQTAQSYADPLIFLFLGGFLLAAAMQRAGLHRRIALLIVARLGAAPGRMVLGFMIATAFLSMWISNTATTMMMYAVGLSVLDRVAAQEPDEGKARHLGLALMLGIAYSASIGGVGTLIGSPPNALLASHVQQAHGIEVSFARWMMIGLPVVVIMLPLTWLVLTRLVFPLGRMDTGPALGLMRAELVALGRPGRDEWLVGAVLAVAAAGWLLRAPLASATGLPLDDAMIAMAAALVLFAVPVSGARTRRALDWEATRDLPWGVLVLFGGGLALAGGISGTGLAGALGETLTGIRLPGPVMVLIVLTLVVFLTEVTSNTASAATLLPILGAVALGLEMDVLALTLPVALGASMAFMMPVATPPNAIVFACGHIRLADMLRAGLVVNLLAIAVGFGVVILLGPAVFGLSL